MHKLIFFVPEEHKERLKEALFTLGLGRYKKYDKCAFETLGRGQFRPLAGSTPFVGQQGVVEITEEFRVEMLCPDDLIDPAVALLRRLHPYEEPAFELWPVRVV